ncbi:MAG: helix-turn-helix domain-containing protein [Prevotellaceae bacterium]|jgi:transcriptional regulator with XRE-family HTH domain|nr:helix-turn-helix domain-containing protein [Prevotellaceae bacterium]
MNKIGIKIRKLRENCLMSQNDLAEQLGISQTTLHNMECGRSQKIGFLLMNKVSSIFEKDLDYFLENNTVNNHVKENKGQVSCDNFTINNNYPEMLLEELKKLIAAKDEQIALLKGLLKRPLRTTSFAVTYKTCITNVRQSVCRFFALKQMFQHLMCCKLEICF